jgi:hypothetical protein
MAEKAVSHGGTTRAKIGERLRARLGCEFGSRPAPMVSAPGLGVRATKRRRLGSRSVCPRDRECLLTALATSFALTTTAVFRSYFCPAVEVTGEPLAPADGEERPSAAGTLTRIGSDSLSGTAATA